MHRNVKVLIVILSILVALGYVIWLKNKLSPTPPQVFIPTPTLEVNISPTIAVEPLINSSPSATATSSPVVNSSPSAKINNYGE